MSQKKVISKNNFQIIILLLIAVIVSSIYYIDSSDISILKSPGAEDGEGCTEESYNEEGDKIIVKKDCFWRGTEGNKDACIFSGKGLVCGTSEDGKKSYCCEGESEEDCKCDTEIKNPCESEEDCLSCMCFGEARGESKECKKHISCIKKNRKDSNLYEDTYCKVASEGADNNKEELQFKPFRCVCQKESNPDGNNGYCDCCSGDINPNTPDGDALAECNEIAEDIKTNPNACNGYSADSFYAGNPNGDCGPVCGRYRDGSPKGQKVNSQGCDGHVFCKCN